ncbi:MAG: hypothetical protein Q7T76_01630 [Ferruginibacter sp.]|nr:hypothetical protein [Ferruginibacter sp.]
MKIFLFLLVWVPGSCCLCKAQEKQQRSPEGSRTNDGNQIPTSIIPNSPDKNIPPQASTDQGPIHTFKGGTFFSEMPVMSMLMENVKKPVTYGVMAPGRPQPQVKLGKICAAKVALTGFVLLAGNIPYFIKSLRNDDKTGLKLTSQRGRIAAGNKGFKRVTSLTFAIPLARRF